MKYFVLITVILMVCLGVEAQLPISVRSTNGTAVGPTFSGQVTNNATNTLNGVSQTVPNNLVITGVCGLTAALHTYSWTVASGTMPYDGGGNIGMVFILNGVDQYTIAYQQDATHFFTTTSANSNFVNNSPTLYKPPTLFRDVSAGLGFVRGAIDSGGCYHFTSDSTISGVFLHDGLNEKNNGWTWTTCNLEGLPAMTFQSWTNGFEAFQISAHALYNDLCIVSNDDIAIRGALVNQQFGDLTLGGGINSQTTNIQVRGYLIAGGESLSNSLAVSANLSVGGTTWNSTVAGQTNLINLGASDPNSTAVTVSNLLVIRPNYTGTGALAIDVDGGASGMARVGNGLALVHSTVTMVTINSAGSSVGNKQFRLEGSGTGNEINPNTDGSWDLGDASKRFGNAFIKNNLVMGAGTNTPSFTLVNTNWVSGQLYTNLTGRPIEVKCQAILFAATTGVGGAAQLGLQTNGVNMYSVLISPTATTSVNDDRLISGWIPSGVAFAFTNLSTGTGNTATSQWGQYLVY